MRAIYFALSPQLSAPLSLLGYSCLKLVPCGSVSEVLPWLARRVQENSAAAARAARERDLAAAEMRRRGAAAAMPWRQRE